MAVVRSNLASPSSPIKTEARSIDSLSAGIYAACPRTSLCQGLQGGHKWAAKNQGTRALPVWQRKMSVTTLVKERGRAKPCPPRSQLQRRSPLETPDSQRE